MISGGKIDTKYLLALNAHIKIGSQGLKKILDAFDSPEEAWQASENEIRSKLIERLAELFIEARAKYDPEKEAEKLHKYDVGYITMYDKKYPKILAELPDCPAILYIKGDVSALNKVGLAVVGSRKYTLYGKKVAYDLAKKCAEAGLVIVSGLALGIDAWAHQGALDAGGLTVGVLGCGLDNIYPISNFQLGKSILENGGAIISEFPIGTPPMKQNFPARNRIIAGLSQGTLVIEAQESSGALITAYQALDYNRDVFAVPGNIDSENSIGTNRLIQQGAKLISKADDILTEFNIEWKKSTARAKESLPETPEEKKLIEVLHTGEKYVDEMVAESGYNVVIINSLLTVMEMKGLVQNLGGGRYKLN